MSSPLCVSEHATNDKKRTLSDANSLDSHNRSTPKKPKLLQPTSASASDPDATPMSVQFRHKSNGSWTWLCLSSKLSKRIVDTYTETDRPGHLHPYVEYRTKAGTYRFDFNLMKLTRLRDNKTWRVRFVANEEE